MKLLASLLFPLVLLAGDCISKPCTGSTNFPADLYGPEDTRPGTWGHADSASLQIHFKPPIGYRVRILSLRGDLISWTHGMATRESRDKISGVLLGFSTTAPEGSIHADFLADNCFLYLQDAVQIGVPRRTPFMYDGLDIFLDSDHVLCLKIAAWLNETGLPIHAEGTASIRYDFVRVN